MTSHARAFERRRWICSRKLSGSSTGPDLVANFSDLLEGNSPRVFGSSRIGDFEAQLRKEFAALQALDQGCAVPDRVLDLRDGHASCQLVQNLLCLAQAARQSGAPAMPAFALD